jgi:hypothetical protein
MERFSLVSRAGLGFGFGFKSLGQKDSFSISNRISVKYWIRIGFGKKVEFLTTEVQYRVIFDYKDKG